MIAENLHLFEIAICLSGKVDGASVFRFLLSKHTTYGKNAFKILS